MTEIQFRLLLPTDHSQYRRARLECLQQFPTNFGSTHEEESQNKELKLDKAIKIPSITNFVYGAFATKDKLIGICGFITESRKRAAHRGEVIHMFVDKTYNGKGIGKKLLQLTLNTAFSNPQIEQIILSAVLENQNAINFYKKMGFTEYGRIENWFKMEHGYTGQIFMVKNKNIKNY